jgi:hypothetical protein
MSLPTVESAKLYYVKQFTLNNFVEKYQDLDQKFSFLANSTDYAKYYRSLELSKGESEEKLKPKVIDNLGPLKPLKKKHTLHSYWKSFRLPLNTDKDETNNELFLLLPLRINIPIKSIIAANQIFSVKLYMYLFPFGSCCMNMEVDIPKLDCYLDKFPKLISDIMIANFSAKKGSFESFSIDAVKKLNKALFGNEDGFKKNPTHTYVFLDTSIPLSLEYPEHKKAIVAIMERKNIEELPLKEEYLNEKTKCELDSLNNGEILLFSPKCTFIYPSRVWIRKVTTDNKVKRKYLCMSDNYCSFINQIFAVNRFIEDSFSKNKKKLPKERAQEITKCFTMTFLDTSQDGSNNIYYKKAFEKISKEINLDKKLRDINR